MVLFVFRNEAADRTVVGTFTLRRENTARQLLHLPVIGDALAAVAFPLARLISTGASRFIPIDMTFRHLSNPFHKVVSSAKNNVGFKSCIDMLEVSELRTPD